MNASVKISTLLLVFLLLQSCGGGMNQKSLLVKTDSLYIRVRCVRTVSELIENSMVLPAQKKLRYRMDYMNETYPDTITRQQAEKMIVLKETTGDYELLLQTLKDLQKRSDLQLTQVTKLNAGVSRIKEEELMQYISFENKCADTLNTALNVIIKKTIELACKSQSLN